GRRCGDLRCEAQAVGMLHRVERICCRWLAAEESGAEALEIFERDGYRLRASLIRRGLSIVAWKRGHLLRALSLADRCLSEVAEFGHKEHEWFASLLRGMILLHRGEFETAHQLFKSGAAWSVPRGQSRPSLLTTEFLG